MHVRNDRHPSPEGSQRIAHATFVRKNIAGESRRVGCDGIEATEYLECPLSTLVQHALWAPKLAIRDFSFCEPII
jgi:hypothetical protein